MSQQSYQEIIHRVERLHRRFLDVLSIELVKFGIEDINNVQALIAYNIGPDTLTVGELTARGYYLGSNVSYNLKKLVEAEYIVNERSAHDKRSVRVKLSDKGIVLRRNMSEMFQRHVDKLAEADLSADQLGDIENKLANVEAFLTAQLAYAGITAPRD
ncbi:MAG TPA: MarR family transcriptional regulator [Alphaproteobacteria bacterium]|nr:MarR family transcriptional regulator [Alphaproteobacteria bacterium]